MLRYLSLGNFMPQRDDGLFPRDFLREEAVEFSLCPLLREESGAEDYDAKA